ncbi:MAG TPA: 2-oxo acid dehydrogenase subunit E2 [Pirellulaceae bacterium]|nr:2-oxo acid dehydrogenase subunit E2 [Pirellulaceae bacterium]HMO91863.1 2-oxo acid dehydrogenase subunit E2 [Pirellulaceae bacterium]HMP69727.1 2-oxo acid dehydrogenase subunit E2 [Pirellulaceae bacterium]
MAVDILVPNLGDGIESADVLEVLVKVGDVIQKEDGIVELETDKATAIVPSTASGKIVKVHVSEGDSIPVGQVILTLEPIAESAPAEQTPAAPAKPKSEASPTDVSQSNNEVKQAAAKNGNVREQQPSERVEPRSSVDKTGSSTRRDDAADVSADAQKRTSPQAVPMSASVDAGEIPAGPAMRRLAREVGVDLSRVSGSGSGGRITRDDIMSVVRSDGRARQSAQPTSGEQDQFGPVRVEKLSRMRRTIARQMHDSWTSVPRVTNFDDADVTDLEKLRQTSKADYAARGIKLTSLPFVIKSVALALREHPIINSSLAEDQEHIIYKNYVNIGVAVDTDRGLVVPVMRDADQLSIPDIAKQLALMAEKVRNNDFTLDELKGGTFTISNLGAIGGTYSTPIVNVPENAIILIGKSRKLPVVKDNDIVPRLMMPLSISYDHRLVDGAAAARFLNDVISYLEAPSRLLLAP